MSWNYFLILTSVVQLGGALPCTADDAPAKVKWIDAAQATGLSVEGLPWFKTLGKFRRLPLDPLKKEFSDDVNGLADNTAGAQIRFRTTSPFVRVRVQLTAKSFMYHMPASGQSGVDLYDEVTGVKRLCGIARVNPETDNYEAELCSWGNDTWKDVTLNLPLYNGVQKFEIGIAEGAILENPKPHKRAGKIAIYGTSITQGGVASRPGMGWTNQLSRAVDQEVINLGFSGSGMGEPALAKRIAEIEDLKLVVLDYEANAQDGVRTTLKPFIALIRARYPQVPIVVVSQIPWIWQIRSTGYANYKKGLRDFQSQTVAELTSAGDKNIFFIDGYSLMPLDHFEDGLVDGVHPNDLGQTWIATGLFQQLSPLFK